MASAFADIVSSSTLDVVAPTNALGFPSSDDIQWLEKVKEDVSVDRKQAFYDERLVFFLIHRLESPESSTPTNTLSPESSTPQPPALLLSYLSYLQVSYEASYIPQQYPLSPGPPGTAHPNPPLTARSPVPPLASPLLSATRPASTGPPASASLHLSAPPPHRPSSLAPPVQSYSLPPPQTQGHKVRGHVPPSIVPPVTPHPTPSTRVEDRRYAGANVREQGVLLVGGIWGEERDGRKSLSNGTVFEKGRQSAEEAEQKEESRFQLLWDEKDGVWVAVYKLWVDVAFLRTPYPHPLLCLTVSTTLRSHPVHVTPARSRLTDLIEAIGGIPDSLVLSAGGVPGSEKEGEEREKGDGTWGHGYGEDKTKRSTLEEVNLFAGLAGEKILGSKDGKPLDLPSTRLGPQTRRSEFGLGPPLPMPSSANSSANSAASTISPTAMATTSTHTNTVHPTMRKSFRKTLQVVSGFRVRMRTVFVPYVLLPGTGDSEKSKRKSEGNEGLGGREGENDELQAGGAERTVVLCIEIENGGEAGSGFGFEVEGVDVKVGGGTGASRGSGVKGGGGSAAGGEGGTRVRLIEWDRTSVGEGDEGKGAFPLRVGSMEQFNLLYAVEFLEDFGGDGDMLAGRDAKGMVEMELQRAVVINVLGKPYHVVGVDEGFSEDGDEEKGKFGYPTDSFNSRWNCVLDLSPKRNRDSLSVAHTSYATDADGQPLFDGPPSGLNDREALPEPASPFPTATSRAQSHMYSPGPTPLRTSSLTPTVSLANSVAGSKRHTMPIVGGPARRPPMNYRSSTSLLNPANALVSSSGPSTPVGIGSTPTSRDSPSTSATSSHSPSSYFSPYPGGAHGSGFAASTPGIGPSPLSKVAYTPTPPSLAVQTYIRPPGTPTTTFAPPPPPTPLLTNAFGSAIPPPKPIAEVFTDEQEAIAIASGMGGGGVPPTPAYPAYPNSPFPSTSRAMDPVAGWGAGAGASAGGVPNSVDIPRSRGVGGLAPAAMINMPGSPGPRVGAGYAGGFRDSGIGFGSGSGSRDEDGEKIVVSIGLVHEGGEQSKIYPHDEFTLDVFVFNQSSWTRRFEVSCPGPERRRRKLVQSNITKLGGDAGDGICPLDNRIRVGPLKPATCQSVRMGFMALAPGVHRIDTVTLLDVETGYSMNLRSVMDIVVHEVPVQT